MKIDDAIIDKVLNNKASAEDAKAVSEWLATEEGHDYLSKRIDREVSSLTENEVEDWVPHVIPEEKMQQRFLQQITLRRRVNSYRRWWAAAVLIPFIFLCGSVWFLADKVGLFSETEYAELVVPCGEQMRVVLQDGTIVQLNSDTRLKYPKKFGIFNRTVELWGEGYFEVAKDPSKPFQVEMNGASITVLGTHFNVKADAESDDITATLVEGSIRFEGAKQNIVMTPNQQLTFSRSTNKVDVKEIDTETFTAWKDGLLKYKSIPFIELIENLKDIYQVEIRIDDEILADPSITVSGTFDQKQSIEQILKVISCSLPVQWTNNDGIYHIQYVTLKR